MRNSVWRKFYFVFLQMGCFVLVEVVFFYYEFGVIYFFIRSSFRDVVLSLVSGVFFQFRRLWVLRIVRLRISIGFLRVDKRVSLGLFCGFFFCVFFGVYSFWVFFCYRSSVQFVGSRRYLGYIIGGEFRQVWFFFISFSGVLRLFFFQRFYCVLGFLLFICQVFSIDVFFDVYDILCMGCREGDQEFDQVVNLFNLGFSCLWLNQVLNF